MQNYYFKRIKAIAPTGKGGNSVVIRIYTWALHRDKSMFQQFLNPVGAVVTNNRYIKETKTFVFLWI